MIKSRSPPPLAFGANHPQIETGRRITLVGGFTIPPERLLKVLRHTALSLRIQGRQVDLRRRIALARSLLVPRERFLHIFRGAPVLFAQYAQIELSGSKTLIGGQAVPFQGFLDIRGRALSIKVHGTQIDLGQRITLFSRAPIPFQGRCVIALFVAMLAALEILSYFGLALADRLAVRLGTPGGFFHGGSSDLAVAVTSAHLIDPYSDEDQQKPTDPSQQMFEANDSGHACGHINEG